MVEADTAGCFGLRVPARDVSWRYCRNIYDFTVFGSVQSRVETS